MAEILQKHAAFNEAEQWEQLVCELHFLDIKILEYVYLRCQGAIYFNALLKSISKFNVKRTAVRNHIAKLEELGLIETIKSGMLFVNSIPEISENVKKLILKSKLRWDEE